MTPEQHERLVRNMRLRHNAKRALLGRSSHPRKDLAALFDSDVDMGAEVRAMLARFFSGDAAGDRLPIAEFSGYSHKDWPQKVEARIVHLRRGLDCEENCRGKPRIYAREVAKVPWSTMERSMLIAATFHRWFDHEMPSRLRDPVKLGMGEDEWWNFLYETFADWLLENPGDDPLVFPRDKKPQTAFRG